MCRTLYFYFCIPYNMLTTQNLLSINSPYSWPPLYLSHHPFSSGNHYSSQSYMFVFVGFLFFLFIVFFPFLSHTVQHTESQFSNRMPLELEAQSSKQWTTRKVCF